MFGLTGKQTRQEIAAHELGHAVVAMELGLKPKGVWMLTAPEGEPHGGTAVEASGVEGAAVLAAGAIAGEHWLRTRGLDRHVSRADMTYVAQGDEERIARLGLTPAQEEEARDQAARLLDRAWSRVEAGIDPLVEREHLGQRDLARLGRSGGGLRRAVGFITGR